MQITLTLTLPDLPRIGLRRALRTWRHRARSRRDLARLDAHLLRDIGLTSGRARAEAARSFFH